MNTNKIGKDIDTAVNEEKSSRIPSSVITAGALGVLAAGGYILWTNRFKVQRFLESQGIPTPWMNGSVAEGVASGVAKTAGAVESEVKAFTQPNSFAALAKDAKNVIHS